MNERPDFIVRRALARAVRTARQVSAAIALSLGLGAASVAHAGVPLPVLAETTGMLTLATVVKRMAPSVVTIEGRGRVAAEPGAKRRCRSRDRRGGHPSARGWPDGTPVR